LSSGAPSWLSIDPSTGQVWGTIPDGVNSFSYSVTAWNNSGWVTAGPFTVFFWHRHVNIHTSLSCTSPVYTGQHGTCTLWVSNWGPSAAPDVTAQISLPWQLRADYCGLDYWFYYGCSISNNTAFENLGTLYPRQTKELTVVFNARTGYVLWGRHRGHRFTVEVVGSAASHGYYWFFGQRESYSVAYVTVIPRGIWW
jgi:Putative Ig domain